MRNQINHQEPHHIVAQIQTFIFGLRQLVDPLLQKLTVMCLVLDQVGDVLFWVRLVKLVEVSEVELL